MSLRTSGLLLCLLMSIATLQVRAAETHDPLASPASFSAEGRALKTQGAIAVLTDRFFNGQTLALEIIYTAKAISPTMQKQIQENGLSSVAAETEAATLVLFLDKSNQLWQVNLTVVLAGRTTGNTIASAPEELQKFQQFSFDGQRVKLRSKGTFKSSDPDFPAAFTWDVNDDLPVFDGRKKAAR